VNHVVSGLQSIHYLRRSDYKSYHVNVSIQRVSSDSQATSELIYTRRALLSQLRDELGLDRNDRIFGEIKMHKILVSAREFCKRCFRAVK